ncbi:MAG: 30S ribosome-binding factor RbfA [Spirochaetales bacterium]|nr:30S ribosome-binding factor RbfA [Spirochaetales bacterium]
MSEVRIRKVESLLLEEISEIILKEDLKDPRINKLLSITEVRVSKDLGHAKVYVSYYGDRDTFKIIVNTLNHASGFIRGLLGKRIRLRTIPELKFILDESIEKGFNLIRKIEETLS